MARGVNGTHGVLLLNSKGMDIKVNDTAGQYLEHNNLGGIFDFYFLAGPSPGRQAGNGAIVDTGIGMFTRLPKSFTITAKPIFP